MGLWIIPYDSLSFWYIIMDRRGNLKQEGIPWSRTWWGPLQQTLMVRDGWIDGNLWYKRDYQPVCMHAVEIRRWRQSFLFFLLKSICLFVCSFVLHYWFWIQDISRQCAILLIWLSFCSSLTAWFGWKRTAERGGDYDGIRCITYRESSWSHIGPSKR